jgi:hypothetical protein
MTEAELRSYLFLKAANYFLWGKGAMEGARGARGAGPRD